MNLDIVKYDEDSSRTFSFCTGKGKELRM